MPRGGHRVKAAKADQVDTPPVSRFSSVSSMATKLTRTNTDRRTSMLSTNLLSRSSTEPQMVVPATDRHTSILNSHSQRTSELDLTITSVHTPPRSEDNSDCIHEETNQSSPSLSRTPSIRSLDDEDSYEVVLEKFDNTSNETSQASPLSSTFSRDSVSVNSRASSICSSRVSIYSLEECGFEDPDRNPRTICRETTGRDTDTTLESRLPGGLQYQSCSRSSSVRRHANQDAALRERSSLARKAALFKNSRLRPDLPTFSTSLSTWSMVCRAAQASEDCYGSPSLTRRGLYTPADTSKDIKAMIVDEHFVDDSRIIIVAIRGTQLQSLTDWVVNKAANPVKPRGFLDNEENLCHEGFFQVTKAMVSQVADQLRRHTTSSEKPSLLFTGHSAGGAVAAMLYTHMLCTSVHSNLTALTSQFQNVNCITFGAPPLSLMPLQKCEHKPGVFLAFANEGDPVLRLTNAAYFKSLAKLMTTSPPPSVTSTMTAPPIKVVRGSRGSTIYKQAVPVLPPVSWEELPSWSVPSASLTNGGDIILLREKDTGCASASKVTVDDLNDTIFADLAQHTMGMYLRRIKDVALAAMMGRNV